MNFMSAQSNSFNPFITDVSSANSTVSDTVVTGKAFLSVTNVPQVNPFLSAPKKDEEEKTNQPFSVQTSASTQLDGEEGRIIQCSRNIPFNPFLAASTNITTGFPFASQIIKNAGDGDDDDAGRNAHSQQSTTASNIVSIRNIPRKFYAKEFLNEHFSKFGVVIKIDFRKLANSANITFVDKVSARFALEKGTIFEEGTEPVIIKFVNTHATKEPAPEKIARNRKSFDNFKISLSNLVQNLQSVRCVDSKSKYDVLDKIDKAIRKGLKRDREKYKALHGTCIDMCPEKERYMRDDRNQTSYYELRSLSDDNMTFNSNDMDHEKAVKEYSRSSADQEEPLSHELRPAAVLKMTMIYLIRNFMNEETAQRADWFDFLWNRTRAIRKDITQQSLHCMTSIGLIEKCARFHIMCSHHLCEHEMHVFDAKINLENLTKCLQTLKHMYEDAMKEKSMVCKNEAEFRCYQILLNLNNADILREVMVFSEVVRDSPSVKFAIQVFSAVHEKNYVRFFKLLLQASYLNACLMHPYFTQMRAVALKLMNRAFSVSKRDILYPLESVKDILSFDDLENTADFCHHYGLSCDDQNVLFNRTSYTRPEETFYRTKSNLISSKSVAPLAEIVMGGPIPTQQAYMPTNSFSLNGQYVGTYHDLNGVTDVVDVIESEEEATAQEEEDNTDTVIDAPIQPELIVLSDSPEEQPQSEEVDTPVVKTSVIDLREKLMLKRKQMEQVDSEYEVTTEELEDAREDEEEEGTDIVVRDVTVMILREDIAIFANDIVEDEIFNTIRDILSEVFTEIKHKKMQSEAVCQQLLALTCIQEVRATVVEVIKEEQLKNEKDKVKIFNETCSLTCEEIIDNYVKTLLRRYCQDVYQNEIFKLEQAVEQAVARKIVDKTITVVVDEDVQNIASNALNAVISERKQNLSLLEQSVKQLKLEKFFHRWVKAYKYQMFIKSTLQEFPPLAPFNTTADVLRSLHLGASKNRACSNQRSFAEVTKIESDHNYKAALQSHQMNHEKRREELLKPISLVSLFEELLQKKCIQNLDTRKDAYWRLAIKCSANCDLMNENLFASMLLKKLRNITGEIDGDDIYAAALKIDDESFAHISVSCISSYIDFHTMERCLHGKSGLMLTLDIPYNVSESFWSNEALTLSNLMNSRRSSTRLPVAIVVLSTNFVTPTQVIDRLKLQSMLGSGLISKFKCVIFDKSCIDASDFDRRLKSILQWLMEESLCFSPLISKSLASFIEDTMATLFFKIYHEHCLYCRNLDLPSPDSDDIVTLYNNVLEEISTAVEQSESQNPEQLDQGSTPLWNDDVVLQTARDMVLQLRLPSLPCFVEYDWDASYENCLNYVTTISPNEASVLTNRVNSLLRHQHQSQFPWSEVLELCIKNKLSSMYLHQNENGRGFQLMVHFYEDNIKNIQVENPLKSHMRELNATRLSLENSFSYHNTLKRRKYTREHSLRDSIESIDARLDELNESFQRKRKRLSGSMSSRLSGSLSSRLSDSFVTSPLQDLLNDTVKLCQQVDEEKEYHVQRSTSRLGLVEKGSYMKQKTSDRISTHSPPYRTSRENSPPQCSYKSSLESSVVDCIKVIDDTKEAARAKLEYWQRIIDGR